MDHPSRRRYTDVETSPRLHARSPRASLRAAQSDENGAPISNQQHYHQYSTRSKRSTNFSAFPPRICDQDALRKISKLYQRDPKRYHTLYHSVFLKEPTYDRFEAELSRIYSNASRWDIENNPIVSTRIAVIRRQMANVAVKYQEKQARRNQILREMAEKKIARWESRHNRVYSPSNSLASSSTSSSTSDVSCQTVDSEPPQEHPSETAAINEARAPQPPPPVRAPQPPANKRRAPQPPTQPTPSPRLAEVVVCKEMSTNSTQTEGTRPTATSATQTEPLPQEHEAELSSLRLEVERLKDEIDELIAEAERRGEFNPSQKSKEKKGTLAKIFSMKKKK